MAEENGKATENGNTTQNQNENAEENELNHCQPFRWFFSTVPRIGQILVGVVLVILSLAFLIPGIIYIVNYSIWSSVDAGLYYGGYYGGYFGALLAGGIIMLVIGIAFGVIFGLGVAYKKVHISCFPRC